MKPAPFKYCAVESVEEACALLAEFGDEAKVIAGGQSLVPLMNMRLARPEVLIDVNGIEDLDYVRLSNGDAAVGAMTRQRRAELSDEVSENVPLLRQALEHVGHVGIRTRGTIGGSVAHADPASEVPTVLRALDGEVLVRGTSGERSIPASEFFVSAFMTSLAEDELLTELRFPRLVPGTRTAFAEVARRHGDFALVGVAVVAERDEEGVVHEARIALSNVADAPVRATEAEAFLGGSRLDALTASEAAQLAGRRLEPPSDVHASTEYRREVAQTLVRRTLEQIAS